jgi:uncharacterized coiled-coil protein SlyX
MRFGLALSCAVGALATPVAPLFAQSASIDALSAELTEARAQIEQQRRTLEAQEARLQALEARLQSVSASVARLPAPGSAPTQVAGNTAVPRGPVGVERVGEAPPEIEMPQVAVLGDQGSIVTRAGQFTAEASFEYARADRNRTLFRGIELVDVLLIGRFDINESRQDVLSTTAGLRYGITDRFEIGVRLPYVYRSDTSILTPIAGESPGVTTVDSSSKGDGIGDLELSARYQLLSARAGRPFLIANLQVVAPTGSNPFEVPRDSLGRQLEAATGAGFWAVAPSLTAILPSDPAVLFGTLGYTHNFGRNVDTLIPPVRIERVEPGDAVSGSFGLGVSLNQRTSFNLGYAHSWVFGTETRTRLIDPGMEDPGPITQTSRDLQLGRFLFGVTYRLNNRANLNWAVELGATDDATDLRTVIRIPIVL